MFCETSKVLILATLGSHRGEEVGGVENTLYNTTFRVHIRDGVKKSKWKFKMAFAMKGGGVSRGSRVPLTYFEK